MTSTMRFASTSSGRFFHTINLNGDSGQQFCGNNNANNGGSGVMSNLHSGPQELSAGDYVCVMCYQDSGGTLSTQVIPAKTLSVRRIG